MTMESTAGWRTQCVAAARPRKLYHYRHLAPSKLTQSRPIKEEDDDDDYEDGYDYNNKQDSDYRPRSTGPMSSYRWY